MCRARKKAMRDNLMNTFSDKTALKQQKEKSLHNSSLENETPYNKTTKLSVRSCIALLPSQQGWVQMPCGDAEHNQTSLSIDP